MYTALDEVESLPPLAIVVGLLLGVLLLAVGIGAWLLRSLRPWQ